MGEIALKLPAKIDRLKAAAETEWKLLGKALLAQQQGGVHARMHRQELGEVLIKLRKEVLHQVKAGLIPKPASTGGRPLDVWWAWFEEWQPPEARFRIHREDARIAMKIAGAEDPEEAEETFKESHRQRQRKHEAKRRVSPVRPSSLTGESTRPISMVVRRIEGMIRKLSIEDQEVLFTRIEDLLP